MFNVVIVRYGEISVKSPKVRKRMEKALVENIRTKLELDKLSYLNIKKEKGRIFIYSSPEECIKIANSLSRVFGITSTSYAIEVDNDFNTIIDEVVKFARKILRENMSFAIRARRVKSYKITSKEIERVLGEKVLEEFKNKVKVNLERPDVTIYVEVREKHAYIFSNLIQGVGGLPYGVEGKVVSLISGGVDSAVASWLIMKRGCKIIPVYCNLEPYTTKEAIERAYNVLRWLRKWVPEKEFYAYIVPLGYAHSKIKNIDERMRCLICKCMMYKIAEKICLLEKAKGIVTGESIGQVASQTLDNLFILSRCIKFPIYRPVIALDKNEITELARKIGVYEIAGKAITTCLLTPKYPITHASEEHLEKIRKVVTNDLINELLQRSEKVTLTYNI